MMPIIFNAIYCPLKRKSRQDCPCGGIPGRLTHACIWNGRPPKASAVRLQGELRLRHSVRDNTSELTALLEQFEEMLTPHILDRESAP